MRALLPLLALPGARASPCSGQQTAQDVAKGHSMKGKVVVYTGGDSGIGYESALSIAEIGAHVIITSYDAHGQGAKAAEKIKKKTGNQKVDVVQLDLSSQASVRSGVADVLKLTSRIDVLLANAGIGCTGTVAGCVNLSPITADGFERVLEVNYLGHYLMVELLLPALRSSSGRVIATSSTSAEYACSWRSDVPIPAGVGPIKGLCMDLDKLDGMMYNKTPGMNYQMMPASNYGSSKFLMTFWMAELAKREKSNGVTAYSVHPGVVSTPMLSSVPKMDVMMWCNNEGHYPCPTTPPQGGATLTYLSIYPTSQLTAGAYYTYCRVSPLEGWSDGAGGGGDGVVKERTRLTGAAKTADYMSKVYDMTHGWVHGKHPHPPAPPAPPAADKYGCFNSKCTPDPGGLPLAICSTHCQ